MKKMKRIVLFLLVAGAPTLLSAGSIIYSNLGPTPATTYFSPPVFATTFTASGTGNLAAVTFEAWVNQSSPGSATAGLYASSSGQLGTLLEGWSFTLEGGVLPTLSTIDSIQSPLLTAGSQYWFVLSSPLGIDWDGNGEGIIGGFWDGTTLQNLSQVFASSPTPIIQLTSTAASAVPEPPGAVLGGLALLLGATLLRVRRSRGRAA
jgi:hypothetical protein